MPGWLKWLTSAADPAAACVFAFRSCKQETPAPPPPPPAATTPAPPAPVAQANARFGFENTAGKVMVSGQLASDADRRRLMDALTAAFGAGNVSGDITVDANTLPAGWIDKLISVLPDLKAAGLKFGFDGDKLTVDTSGTTGRPAFRYYGKAAQGVRRLCDHGPVGPRDRGAGGVEVWFQCR